MGWNGAVCLSRHGQKKNKSKLLFYTPLSTIKRGVVEGYLFILGAGLLLGLVEAIGEQGKTGCKTGV